MSTIVISYPLALPATPAPISTRFTLDYAVAVAESQFTMQQQAQDWGGRIWRAEVAFPPMLRAAADAWLSLFHQLRGRYGWFRMGDWERRAPRGVISGTVLVNGAAQTGNGVAIDGLAPSTSNVLRAGDHISIEDRLYAVVADASSNGAGQATVQIEPNLRSSPADNAAVTYTNPKGLFRLTAAPPYDSDTIGVHGIGFTAIEKWP